MAQVRKRVRADGSTAYQVRWTLGGGRAQGRTQASETFSSLNRALRFKLDVENAGHQWPDGWIKGLGYAGSDDPYTPATPRGTSPTELRLADVAEDFFALQDRRSKRGLLKPYTLHRYRREFDLHLSKPFGSVPFAAIQSGDIDAWIDALVVAGLSPKSIRNHHGLLFMLMKHGQLRMKLRGDNPCELTELPSADAKAARQLRFFQHGEWALLRACLKSDVHLLVDIALTTGMRWGELSALRVEDITWEPDGRAVIHIVRAWSKRAPDDPTPILEEQYETSSWKLGPPKNKRGRYVVTTQEEAEQLRAAVRGKLKSEYVFTTRHGNPWRYQDFYSDRWKPAREDAEQRGLTKHATFHMLRHTTVVWALSQGVKLPAISERLGHASIQITYDVYGGLLNAFDTEIADAMAQMREVTRSAIVHAPTQEEVDARPVRPGPRGANRTRYAMPIRRPNQPPMESSG